MSSLDYLLEKNLNWAQQIKQNNPDFFYNLSKQQRPKYLWIGCSDSRVPANEIMNLPPGEVFVHRNIANIVVHSDLNCLSVLQYAVEILKVKHIIICGHYGCGGIQSAMQKYNDGLIDNWLEHIRDIIKLHADELAQINNKNEKLNLLCELNVIKQVSNIYNTSIVKKALMSKQDLQIHGWIYNINNGILKDLKVKKPS